MNEKTYFNEKTKKEKAKKRGRKVKEKDMESYDVLVIGAGVVGSATARELSRYQLRIAVLEKELDVGCGNSSRNTGMLHAGFNNNTGC